MAAESFPEEGLGAYLDGVGVLIVLSRPSVAAVKNAVSRALADGPLSHPGQAKRAFDRARYRGSGYRRGEYRGYEP